MGEEFTIVAVLLDCVVVVGGLENIVESNHVGGKGGDADDFNLGSERLEEFGGVLD